MSRAGRAAVFNTGTTETDRSPSESTANTPTTTNQTSSSESKPSTPNSFSRTDSPSLPLTAVSTTTTVSLTPDTPNPATVAGVNVSYSQTTGSSSRDRFDVVAPTSSTANANATATIVISVQSQSSDSDASSGIILVATNDEGFSIGAVVGIVASAIVLVVLIAGLAFWLYRRKRRNRTTRSSSFDASYSIASVTRPRVNSFQLDNHILPPAIAVDQFNNFDRTVDLASSGPLDSTLRLESSAMSMPSSKVFSRTGSELWEDEAILAARIPMEKLVVKELINEGGHGAVYHGQYHGKSVAIKMLLPDKKKDLRQINYFLAEIKMMATVEHPRIVLFIGVAWDALSDLCAVSEFLPSGDLFSLLQRFDRVDHRPQGFDGDKAKIAQHVAQALTYLHSLDPIVLHRDLKSMNIMLSESWDAKLTDFGVSRKWTVDTMTAGVGTKRWMAPEVMMGKRYDTSADIFSLGVVLSELDSHQPPYASAIECKTSELGEKVSETALIEMVAAGRIRIKFSPNAPSSLVSLGHACVNLDPRERPSANEVHYLLEKISRKYLEYTL